MKVTRINKGQWGKLRAFFDIRTEEGFGIKGFKIVEGINGLFVGMPSQKGKDDEFFDTVFAERDLRDELTTIALEAYNDEKFMNPTYTDSNDIKVPADNSPPPPKEVEVDELSTETKNKEPVQPFSEDDIPF